MDEELFGEVRLSEHRFVAHTLFERIEGFLLWVVPVPRRGLQREVEEWSGDFGVVSYEVAVISCESEEFPYFCYIGRGDPVLDSFDLLVIHVDGVMSYRDSQEFYGVLLEHAFFGLEEQLVFLKFGQNVSDVFAVSFGVLFFGFSGLRFGVDSHIVHVHCEPSLCDLLGEYGIHHRLESGRGVCEAEEHNCGFE